MAEKGLSDTNTRGWRSIMAAIAVAGLMYLAAVYYTAKQVEAQFYALTDQLDAVPGLVLLNVSFDVGLFSSYANTKWEIEDETVSLDHFIDNGLFKMAMDTVLSDSSLRDELTALLLNKQEEPVFMTTYAGLFDEAVHTDVFLADLNDGVVRLSQTQGFMTLFPDERVEMGASIKRLRVLDEDSDWVIDQLSFSANSQGKGVLDYTLNADKVSVKLDDETALRLSGFKKTARSYLEEGMSKTEWRLAFSDGMLSDEGKPFIEAMQFNTSAYLNLAEDALAIQDVNVKNPQALGAWLLQVMKKPAQFGVREMNVRFYDVENAREEVLGLTAQAQFFIPPALMDNVTLDDLMTVALVSPIQFAKYIDAEVRLDASAAILEEYGLSERMLLDSALSRHNRLVNIAWREGMLHLNGEPLNGVTTNP